MHHANAGWKPGQSARCRPALACCAVALGVCLPVLTSAGTCWAAQNAPEWQSRVQRHLSPADDGTTAAVCGPLERNARRHVVTLKALNTQIADDPHAPPSTVFGVLEGLMGQKPAPRDTSALQRKADGERKTIADLNALLTAAHCAPVDIDHELAQVPGAAPNGPELPKAPPDLVPLPSSR
jgi:hypothetical protein